jgi:hypothetical protein
MFTWRQPSACFRTVQPRGWWRARHARVVLGTVLSALVFSVVSGAVLAPAAQAAPGAERCWDHEYSDKVSVDKSHAPDPKIRYGARWTWCAQNGKVTKFIVRSTYPLPGKSEAYVDIRPVDGRFGSSTFPIYINATTAHKSSYHRFLLSAYGGILYP